MKRQTLDGRYNLTNTSKYVFSTLQHFTFIHDIYPICMLYGISTNILITDYFMRNILGTLDIDIFILKFE